MSDAPQTIGLIYGGLDQWALAQMAREKGGL
jgi:hypothetical protein